MTIVKELIGHDSESTAYLVEDYPYGFRLRCKIRYWIETTKHGQRYCSQTTNPKRPGEVWNKPKKSTYSDLLAMYLNEDGHVRFDALWHAYTTAEAGEAFKQKFPLTSNTEYGKKMFYDFGAIKKAQSVLTCTIRPAGTPEEEEEAKRRSAEACRKALAYGLVMQRRESEAA